MASCLSGGGGGRTYGLDLEIIKSTSSSTITSQTSSPSSTLSESSNSALAISTRKPRTPRKRPNQTYNEAAALLSTAYPNIFSSKNLAKPRKFTKSQYSYFHESSELLLPFRVFDNSDLLLDSKPIQEKTTFLVQPKVSRFCDKSWQSSCGEVNSHGGGGSMEMEFSTEFQDDFDAESILDEEIEEGIDSIMGNLSVNQDAVNESNGDSAKFNHFNQTGSWYGNPMGLGFGGRFEFGFGLGLRKGIRAMRHVDEGNWWNFPTVDVVQISPKTNAAAAAAATTTARASSTDKKKKKKKVEKPVTVAEQEAEKSPEMAKENQNPKPSCGLQLKLKLNFDEVVSAWSDRGCPFSEESAGSEIPAGNDVYARLAQIDLFPDGGGVREASVLRYKEKRRTRLFSKKIRYQVRKQNADQRPRMKGRFVRRPNSYRTCED